MNVLTENPFLTCKKIIKSLKEKKVDIIIVDFHAEATAEKIAMEYYFHAEATAEKIAMGYYLDGEVTAIYGTHTHVQTADEAILEKGTRLYNRYRNDRTKKISNRYGSVSISKKICNNITRKIQSS